MTATAEGSHTTLIRRFINMLYDGLQGIPIKSGHLTTEAGAQALRQSIDAARREDARQRRSLRQITWELVALNAPPAGVVIMELSAVEVFSAIYNTVDSKEIAIHGRRGHTFTLVRNDANEWVVDEYAGQTIEERPGAAHVQTLSEATVIREREALERRRSKAIPDTFDASHYPTLGQGIASGLKKALKIILILVPLAILLLWAVGAHAFIRQRSLYTGRTRTTVLIMDLQIADLERQGDLAKWAEKWGRRGEHQGEDRFWVRVGGWEKQMADSRDRIMPHELVGRAMHCLDIIFWYSSRNEEDAVGYLQRYQDLADRIVPVLEKRPNAEDAEQVRQDLDAFTADLEALR